MARADGSRPPSSPRRSLKLAWWREEIERLGARRARASDQPLSRITAARGLAPARSISRRSTGPSRRPRGRSAARRSSAAPISKPTRRPCGPGRSRWRRASRASRRRPWPRRVHRAQSALAAALYLDDAIASYRRAARVRPRRLSRRRIARGEHRECGSVRRRAAPFIYNPTWRSCAAARSRYCSRASAELPRVRARAAAASAGARGARRAAARAGRRAARCRCAICISPGARRGAPRAKS